MDKERRFLDSQIETAFSQITPEDSQIKHPNSQINSEKPQIDRVRFLKIIGFTAKKSFVDFKFNQMEKIKRLLAKALGKDIKDLTVMIQDRPRHDELMDEVIAAGARVKLFSDVDITGAIATAIDEIDVDLLVGTGGAPEGVITATALKCLGGDFQAKLIPQMSLN